MTPTASLFVVDHFGKYSQGRNVSFVDLLSSGGSITFGRDPRCDLVLRPADPNNDHADKAVSRVVGELVATRDAPGRVEVWNHSSTNWIILTGERGYALNMTPRSRTTVTQSDTVLWIEGHEANYGLNLNIPDTDDEIYKRRFTELASRLDIQETLRQQTVLAASAERLRGSFNPAHQLILETMFADYLSPRPGVFPRPRSVRDVRDELQDSPVCKASYKGPLTDEHVIRALKGAIEAAKRLNVPGIEPLDAERARRPADQAEWTRHRLAMFLLGTGVITRSN